MNIFEKTIKFLFPKRHYFKENWDTAIVLNDLPKSFLVEGELILTGITESELKLKDNSKLWIKGELKGEIIGGKSSLVKVSGNFNGILSVESLILSKEASISGDIYINKLLINEGQKVDCTFYSFPYKVE